VSARIVNGGSGSYMEGQTAVLDCQSDSHGDVQLMWMKDGQQLPQHETGHDHVTLTLSELTSSDAGEYVCVATRDRVSVSSTAIIISVSG